MSQRPDHRGAQGHPHDEGDQRHRGPPGGNDSLAGQGKGQEQQVARGESGEDLAQGQETEWPRPLQPSRSAGPSPRLSALHAELPTASEDLVHPGSLDGGVGHWLAPSARSVAGSPHRSGYTAATFKRARFCAAPETPDRRSWPSTTRVSSCASPARGRVSAGAQLRRWPLRGSGPYSVEVCWLGRGEFGRAGLGSRREYRRGTADGRRGSVHGYIRARAVERPGAALRDRWPRP